uniref:Putative secreted protein n=1 Tax=Amblyomma americanum TaxID=6943 RepID=A0A0C9R3V9_AMBAM
MPVFCIKARSSLWCWLEFTAGKMTMTGKLLKFGATLTMRVNYVTAGGARRIFFLIPGQVSGPTVPNKFCFFGYKVPTSSIQKKSSSRNCWCVSHGQTERAF